MKKYILLAFTMWSAGLTAQQDWDLFPLGQETWFATQDSVFQYYNDSTLTDGAVRTHLFGAQYLYRAFGACTEETVPEFWANEDLDFTLRVDTLYSDAGKYFLPVGANILTFRHLAQLGESWDVPTAAADTFRITCTQVAETEIFSLPDSLKTFTLQFIQNGNESPHPLNGETFLLSKYAGFVRYFSWRDLYYNAENAAPAEILGMKKENANLGFTSSFENYLHYQVGDVLKWHTYDRSSPETEFNLTEEWFLDTVQSITTGNGFLRLNVKRTIYTEVSENGDLLDNYTEVGSDAVFSFSQILLDSVLITPVGHPAAYFETLRYLRAVPTLEQGAVIDTADFIMPRSFSLADCSTGATTDLPGQFVLHTDLGFKETTLDRGEGGIYFLELLGYQTVDTLWGDLSEVPIVSSTKNVAKQPFLISPNPADEVIHITFPQNVEKTRLDVYNSCGQKVATYDLFNNRSIDVSNLPAGMYIFKFTGKDLLHTQKLTVF